MASQPSPLVVFVGVGDDRRSRLAAALLAYRARGRVEALSMSPAAVEPDPVVVRALADIGVDLLGWRSRAPSAELLHRRPRGQGPGDGALPPRRDRPPRAAAPGPPGRRGRGEPARGLSKPPSGTSLRARRAARGPGRDIPDCTALPLARSCPLSQ